MTDSSPSTTVNDRRDGSRVLLIALMLVAFALRVHGLSVQDIWWDEARNIDVALRPILDVAVAPELDIHPPVYFWLLHMWSRLAGITAGMDALHIAYLARFLSALAGTVGVGLLYTLVLRYAGRQGALLAVAVGALSPFWLAESQEARMYSVGFALLMAAAIAFRPELTPQKGHMPLHNAPSQYGTKGILHLALFVMFCVLALLTHYNAVFIVITWYLAWGVWCMLQDDRWPRYLRLLGSGLAMTLLLLPVAPIAMRQIPGYQNPNLTVPSVVEYLWQNWQAYIGGYAYDPELLAGNGALWLLCVLAIFIVGTTIVLSNSARRAALALHSQMFLLVWLLGGLGLYYIAVLDRGAFNVRYSSFVTPALYAMLGIGMASLGRLWRPLAVAVPVFVLVGFVPAIRADLYDPRFAREDIAGVTAWLRQHVGEDDVVFVDQKYPFGFYYERYAIESEDHPEGKEKAAARYLFVDINTIDKRLTEWAEGAEHVFWVQWYESDTDPRRSVAFLLDQGGRRAGEEWFQGYSIDWWEMEPPNRFELAPNLVPLRHNFGRAVETVEGSLPASGIAAGSKLPVVIRWRRTADGTVDRPLKARVGLYNDGGDRVAQNDQRLLNDRHLLPTEWSVDDQPLNVYMLETADDLEAGQYEIRLLVYDAETLAPLDLIDEAGNAAGIETTAGQVTITSSAQ